MRIDANISKKLQIGSFIGLFSFYVIDPESKRDHVLHYCFVLHKNKNYIYVGFCNHFNEKKEKLFNQPEYLTTTVSLCEEKQTILIDPSITKFNEFPYTKTRIDFKSIFKIKNVKLQNLKSIVNTTQNFNIKNTINKIKNIPEIKTKDFIYRNNKWIQNKEKQIKILKEQLSQIS